MNAIRLHANGSGPFGLRDGVAGAIAGGIEGPARLHWRLQEQLSVLAQPRDRRSVAPAQRRVPRTARSDNRPHDYPLAIP
jgi:hypothetical protein